MPKVTLEFNLPEEKEEYLVAMDGGKYYSQIGEFTSYLRSIIKYSNDLPESEMAVYAKIRAKWLEIISGD